MLILCILIDIGLKFYAVPYTHLSDLGQGHRLRNFMLKYFGLNFFKSISFENVDVSCWYIPVLVLSCTIMANLRDLEVKVMSHRF